MRFADAKLSLLSGRSSEAGSLDLVRGRVKCALGIVSSAVVVETVAALLWAALGASDMDGSLSTVLMENEYDRIDCNIRLRHLRQLGIDGLYHPGQHIRQFYLPVGYQWKLALKFLDGYRIDFRLLRCAILDARNVYRHL